MGALGSSDLPISVATMLSRLAAGGQGVIRQVNLPTAFTLRRPQWARSGVKITPATKKKLESEVYDRNPYMVAQEESGLKYPKYGRYIAIPLRGARPTRQALIQKKNLPHAVMEAGGFIRHDVMYKPLRRGARTRGVLPMYYLVDHWKWRPRYEFRGTIVAYVDTHYEAEFRKAFAQYSSR